MRIGILGAGNMADALGTQWVRAGHEVMISGRDLDRARRQTERMNAQAGVSGDGDSGRGAVPVPEGGDSGPGVVPVSESGSSGLGVVAGPEGGVRVGTWAEAAAFGDVVMLAVREAGLIDVLQGAGTALRGKPLIDVTNAAAPDRYDPTRPIAQLVSDLTGGHVVKAFNLCHVDVWRMTPPVFEGRPLAVPLCGDDAEALERVRGLVRDLGCTPFDGGGLVRAAQLEATAAFVIGLWFGGVDAQAILPPLVSSGAHLPS